MYYYLSLVIIQSNQTVAIRFLDELNCGSVNGFMQTLPPLMENYKDTRIVPGNEYDERDFNHTFPSYDDFRSTQGVFCESTVWIGTKSKES